MKTGREREEAWGRLAGRVPEKLVLVGLTEEVLRGVDSAVALLRARADRLRTGGDVPRDDDGDPDSGRSVLIALDAAHDGITRLTSLLCQTGEVLGLCGFHDDGDGWRTLDAHRAEAARRSKEAIELLWSVSSTADYVGAVLRWCTSATVFREAERLLRRAIDELLKARGAMELTRDAVVRLRELYESLERA